MVKVITVQDVRVKELYIFPDGEGGIRLRVGYVLLEPSPNPDGQPREFSPNTIDMPLNGTQRNTLTNFITNQVVPKIKETEGI